MSVVSDWVPRAILRWWWILRQRDSETAPEDTFGSPSYKYGKVDNALRVVTQTSETPYVCCGYCSTHMAARTAKAGLSDRMQEEAHSIRAAGGRPHDSGSNAQELRDGAAEAIGVTLYAVTVDEVPDRVRAGYACEIAVQYGDLPDYLKIQGNDFGHSVCLFGWKEDGQMVGFFDPLWPQGAQGAWAKWSDVRRAMWGDGNHSSTIAILQSGVQWGTARWGSSAWA
jgi:hypothetical protein